jgi:vacuolar-type H+-ATPase subunit I/STV1
MLGFIYLVIGLFLLVYNKKHKSVPLLDKIAIISSYITIISGILLIILQILGINGILK